MIQIIQEQEWVTLKENEKLKGQKQLIQKHRKIIQEAASISDELEQRRLELQSSFQSKLLNYWLLYQKELKSHRSF
jgi:hypothetical protein